MDFYTSIHSWYDQIFPYQEIQRTFVLKHGSDPGWTLADAGCGTGKLLLNLSKDFGTLIGLDPDGSMLRIAEEQALEKKVPLDLRRAGMLDLTRELSENSLHRLVCFGNTLPHLASIDEVGEFIRQAAWVLKPGGKFLLQVINYERIIDNHLDGLPALENENVIFERKYIYPENPVHVAFRTKLTIKSTSEVIENEVPLLAIRPHKIRKILEDQGFSDIIEYGSVACEPFTPQSQPYILSASPLLSSRA
jgi:ubiquinone/menaquinone biosynthesis C-methylase UbiE